jgi:hypothetical protein
MLKRNSILKVLQIVESKILKIFLKKTLASKCSFNQRHCRSSLGEKKTRELDESIL